MVAFNAGFGVNRVFCTVMLLFFCFAGKLLCMENEETESSKADKTAGAPEVVSVEAFNNLVGQVAAIAQALSLRDEKPGEGKESTATIDDLATKIDELASKLSAAEEKSNRDSKSLADSILSLRVVTPEYKTEKREWAEMNLV